MTKDELMDKSELLEKLDDLTEMLGAENAVEALAEAMESRELESDLRFINRMYDLNLFDEDKDEED